MAVTGTSTGVYQLTAEGDVIDDGLLSIGSIRWITTTTGAAGNVCKITYNSGKPLFCSIANGADFVDGWVLNRKGVATLTLASLSSGLVHIYTEIQ